MHPLDSDGAAFSPKDRTGADDGLVASSSARDIEQARCAYLAEKFR